MKASRFFAASALLFVVAFAAAASDPASQALALYKALQKQNWKALYYLAAYSPSVKQQLGSPDKFAADVKKGFEGSGGSDTVKKIFAGMKNIRVGKAAVKGNHATVPTSVDITFNGKTAHFIGLARMIKDGGVWKWDLASGENIELETSKAIKELIGKPKS